MYTSNKILPLKPCEQRGRGGGAACIYMPWSGRARCQRSGVRGCRRRKVERPIDGNMSELPIWLDLAPPVGQGERKWPEEACRCYLCLSRGRSILAGDGVAAAVSTFFGRGGMVGADTVSFSFASLWKNPLGGRRGSVPSGFRRVWAGLDGV
jgi:hypothetical protein